MADVAGFRAPVAQPARGPVLRVVLRAAVLTGGVVFGVLLIGGHPAHAAGVPVGVAAPSPDLGGAAATHAGHGQSHPRVPGLPGTASAALSHPPASVVVFWAAPRAAAPAPVPRIVPVQLVQTAINTLPLPPAVTAAVSAAATAATTATAPLQPLAAAAGVAPWQSPATTQDGWTAVPAAGLSVASAEPSAALPPGSQMSPSPVADDDQDDPDPAPQVAGPAGGITAPPGPHSPAPLAPRPAKSPCSAGIPADCAFGAGGTAAAIQARAYRLPRPSEERLYLPAFMLPPGLGAARPTVPPD